MYVCRNSLAALLALCVLWMLTDRSGKYDDEYKNVYLLPGLQEVCCDGGSCGLVGNWGWLFFYKFDFIDSRLEGRKSKGIDVLLWNHSSDARGVGLGVGKNGRGGPGAR